MKRYRVLQFPVRNTRSGVTQYILNNWKFIDKSKFIFDYVTFDNALDYEQQLNEQGCIAHHISCKAEDNLEQFITECGLALDYGYDAIHLHTSYWKNFTVEQIAKDKGIPVIIVHSHNTDIFDMSQGLERDRALERHNIIKSEFSSDLATHFCACSK